MISYLKLAGRMLWSAGPDFALAATFLITWIAPYTFGERSVHRFTFLMLLEFLVVHSTGFLGAISVLDNPLKTRIMMYAGLVAMYCLFAAGFCAMYGGPWPLFAFLILTLSKFPNIVLRPPDSDGQFIVMGNWAAMTALYLFGALLTLEQPIPPLGVTPEVIAAQQFGVGGEWPEQPYRVMAFGAFYFTGLGIISILTEIIPFMRGRRKNRVQICDYR